MLSISSISHSFIFGSGKSAKQFQVSNHGMSGARWVILSIGNNGIGKEIAYLEQDNELGITLTPGKSGRIDIPTLFSSVADIACHNLPSISNPSPENQGSILMAVCFQVAANLKGSVDGVRINANCEPVPAIKQDWITAYIELETMFNFPLYCRDQFVATLRENNLFIEFPGVKLTEIEATAKQSYTTDELKRLSAMDLQAIAMSLEIDCTGTKNELIKRISAALNPVVA